jgi:hypothetical protein
MPLQFYSISVKVRGKKAMKLFHFNIRGLILSSSFSAVPKEEHGKMACPTALPGTTRKSMRECSKIEGKFAKCKQFTGSASNLLERAG